jgi:RNA polymerase sigma-70 factor (ECF subfamily)
MMIERAARGETDELAAFAVRYAPPIRAYLSARWCGTSRVHDIEDAVQNVFVECLKDNGVLARARRDHVGGFRAFLYGTVRNVARRFEAPRGSDRERPEEHATLDQHYGDETRLSMVFDRAWALEVMREAAARMSERAARHGEEAVQRVEILRLRFEEGLPVRAIAARIAAPAERVHREYARARREFKEALLDVMSFYHGDDRLRATQECAHLLAVLG